MVWMASSFVADMTVSTSDWLIISIFYSKAASLTDFPIDALHMIAIATLQCIVFDHTKLTFTTSPQSVQNVDEMTRRV